LYTRKLLASDHNDKTHLQLVQVKLAILSSRTFAICQNATATHHYCTCIAKIITHHSTNGDLSTNL